MRTNNAFSFTSDTFWAFEGICLIIVFGAFTYASVKSRNYYQKKLNGNKGPQLESELKGKESTVNSLRQQQHKLEEQIRETETSISSMTKKKELIMRAENKIRTVCRKGYAICNLLRLVEASHVEEIMRKLSSLKTNDAILKE